MPGPMLEPAFQFSLTTLELLRRKGLITDVEYAAALNDMSDIGQNAAKAPTVMVGKFATTFYGFVEADFIHDSTRGFIDLAGNSGIASPANLDQYNNGQTLFGARNSRLGFRIKSPDFWGFRPSALVEADFLGNQPGNPPLTDTGTTALVNNGTTTTLLGGTSSGSAGSYKEASFWQNPTFRIRHMLLRLDNDIISMWFGQTWELVGFQSAYHPNTVEIQGVPGQIYSRTPQLRLLHDFKFGDVATLEIAVAALRPPQEDSSIPDLQGGIRLSIDGYKGLQTAGATGTAMQPASIAISGAYRWYSLATGSTKSDGNEQQIAGNVIAADIMIPIISPAFDLPIALTFVGETSFGTGDADIFTSLSGGVGVGSPPGYPAPGSATYTGAYPQSYQAGIDPGLAGWNSKHVLETVDWRSVLVGAQLYLPPDDKIWLSANYSNIYSDNSADFGGTTEAQEWWWDVNLFADITPAVRLGLEFARFHENFNSGVPLNARGANDERVQFSGFFIF